MLSESLCAASCFVPEPCGESEFRDAHVRASGAQESEKVIRFHPDGRGVLVRMHANQRRRLKKECVQIEDHAVLRIVQKPQRRDRTGMQPRSSSMSPSDANESRFAPYLLRNSRRSTRRSPRTVRR